MSNPVDLSSLPEEERQQLQQLQERFQEHQQQQQQQQQQVPNHPLPSSGSSQVQIHPPYDQPYQPYYEYYPPYPAPVHSSLQHPPFPPDQQQHYYPDHQLQPQPQHYYPTEHINAYQEHPNPHPQQLPHQIVPVAHPSAHLINLPIQPQSQHVPPSTGQVQVHHQQNVYYPQIGRSEGDQRQSGPLNPAAAAAVAALSQLVQFAGTMGDAERALAMIGLQASGVAGYGPPMGPSVGPQLPHDPVSFMPLAGQSMYMGGNTRGGSSSFSNKSHGKIRQKNSKGKIGPKLPPQPSSSVPEGTAANKPQTPAAWCELCKVECTSQEILKQHMIGKRHMKNLEKAATSSTAVQNNPNNNTADATALSTAPAVITDSETANAQPQANEESSNNSKPAGTTNSLPGQKREPNHKTKGGKRAKLSDMQKRTFENPKPKVVVPLLCGLCNIKCDTQEVLNKHLSGKKHLSKLKRFEAHPQAGYDQNRIQPLYHPNAPIGPPPLHFAQAHLHHQQPYYPPLLPPAAAPPPAILPFVEGNQNQQLG